MPATINGIGTHYYGRRNPTTHYGFCNQCKRELLLTDYETTLWFCVIYIPIIPLGKQQIVNQCPGCTYHYAVPLKNWQKQADEAVEKASESLAENTSDAAKAMDMHATLSGFHRHEESAELAKVLLSKFGDNSEVLFYLASWHEHFTRYVQADELFVKASNREPSDMDKQAAAVFALARQNELDLALKRLEMLKPPAIPDRVSLVRHVARQLAANGRPADAYKLLSELLKAAPHLKILKDIQVEIRGLEKRLSVKQSLLPSAPIWSQPLAKWIGIAAAIVLAVAGAEGWNYYISQHATVHAISGINAPLQFSVDGGAPLTIPPNGHITLPLPEGSHRVAVISPKLPGADPFDFSVTQSWFARFNSKPAFVVDPSRTGVLVHTRLRYSKVQFHDAADQNTFHIAMPWTTYAHVDHPFEEFPKQVKGKENDIIFRTRIGDETPPVYLLNDFTTPNTLIEMAKRQLTVDPTNSVVLNWLSEIMKMNNRTPEFIEFTKSHLTDEPIMLDWHRNYQSAHADRTVLIEEYDRLLQAHPQSAPHLYLRGRLDEEIEKSFPFFDRAIAADPQFMYSYYAKGYAYKDVGKYVEAAEMLAEAWNRVLASAPNGMEGRSLELFRAKIADDRLESLLAAGKYDEFNAAEKAMRDKLGPGEPPAMAYLAILRQGKKEDLEKYRQEFAARISRVPVDDKLTRGSMRLANAIYEGDLRLMREAALQMPDPPRQQVLNAIAFDEGTETECKAILGVDNALLPVLENLLTSLRCRERGELLGPARSKALDLLKSGVTANPALLALFEKSPAVATEEIDKISLRDRERGILLIALAYENPPQKEAMLRYARKLLAIPRLPQKCFDDWIKSGLGE